jgi:hypothetical protein
MRIVFCVCSLFASLLFFANQQPHADPYWLGSVRRAVTNNSIGIDFGADDKQIPLLGDLCAVAILKTVDEPDLTEPKTVRGILLTIASSFSSPQNILIDEDKEPRVTLFLLNYLRRNVHSAELQQEIRRTIEFVKKQNRTP